MNTKRSNLIALTSIMGMSTMFSGFDPKNFNLDLTYNPENANNSNPVILRENSELEDLLAENWENNTKPRLRDTPEYMEAMNELRYGNGSGDASIASDAVRVFQVENEIRVMGAELNASSNNGDFVPGGKLGAEYHDKNNKMLAYKAAVEDFKAMKIQPMKIEYKNE